MVDSIQLKQGLTGAASRPRATPSSPLGSGPWVAVAGKALHKLLFLPAGHSPVEPVTPLHKGEHAQRGEGTSPRSHCSQLQPTSVWPHSPVGWSLLSCRGMERSSAEAEPSSEEMGCRPAAARLWLGLGPRNYPLVSPRGWEANGDQ